MGRLIPAGTGMKYYRNVEVPPDPTENRKEEDEFDEMADIRGGFDIPLPANMPGVEADDDLEIDEEIEAEDLEVPDDEALALDEADVDDDF